jgi:hypothetical protein
MRQQQNETPTLAILFRLIGDSLGDSPPVEKIELKESPYPKIDLKLLTLLALVGSRELN